MNPFLKRTWAQVDLDNLEHNYKTIRNNVNKKSKIMCVVKADAYGHGAERLAKEFELMGADWLGVSNIEEAMQIRVCGVKLPILILGYTPAYMVETLAANDISQAVISEAYALELSEYAVKAKKRVKVHIKIDTGMGRVGLLDYDNKYNDAVSSIERIKNLEGIYVEGIFTHFASSDECSTDSIRYTKHQYNNFINLLDNLEKKGINIPIKHCSNSGAIINHPEMNLDMVRPGIILYGLNPSGNLKRDIGLKPVMQLKTVVSLVKAVPEGTCISYGRKFITKRETKIATLPIGYADGYARGIFTKAQMILRSKKANIIGSICMDQLMLDVTDIENVKEGDVVTVFGTDNNVSISVDDLAEISGLINYEVVCFVGKRVPRIYYKNSEIVEELNYIYP